MARKGVKLSTIAEIRHNFSVRRSMQTIVALAAKLYCVKSSTRLSCLTLVSNLSSATSKLQRQDKEMVDKLCVRGLFWATSPLVVQSKKASHPAQSVARTLAMRESSLKKISVSDAPFWCRLRHPPRLVCLALKRPTIAFKCL